MINDDEIYGPQWLRRDTSATDVWGEYWIGVNDGDYRWTVFHPREDNCSIFPHHRPRFEVLDSNAAGWYLAQLEPMHSMFLTACPECIAKVFVGSFGVAP